MQHSFLTKLLAAVLSVLFLMSGVTALPVFATDADAVTDAEEEIADLSTDITFYENLFGGSAGTPYSDYRSSNTAAVPDENIVIDATQYDAANTTAAVEILTDFEGADTALYMPSSGITSWKINVPEDGSYAIRITYYPITEYKGENVSTYTTIERTLYIDGHIPFSEARYFYFPRSWAYEDYTVAEDGTCEFPTDAAGNDVRPLRNESPSWQTYYLRDWLGYTMEPFQFTLTAGEHVISFGANREPIVVTDIELYAYEGEPTYEEFLEQKLAEGVKIIEDMDEIITVQAENPTYISNSCLYPTNDRTSPLTMPQDPQKIRFNILNSSTVNQWMQYTVTVPEAGLYTIAIRYRQNDLIGMFTSRRILVNNEIQFSEASNIRFQYKSGWQSSIANNGDEEFMFYLEEGENTITFEVVLGDMTSYVYQVGQMIDRLNDAYQQILQLTGPTPDAYRDYGFNRLVPDAVKIIAEAAVELDAIAESLEEVTGELGDQVATLYTIAKLFKKMGKSESAIASNFVTFKSYIIALSNWLYASLNQPLKMDYFTIQGCDDAKPRASANFFEAIWFEIKAFIGSFFMDYTTVDFKSDVEYSKDQTVEQWITSALGRDDALITRNLVDTYFTPESGITVKMKVVTAGLQEAILAGIGPDIATMSAVDTITWGLRNAVEELDEMEGYDEVLGWIDQAALTPLQMTDAYGEFHTYGMPQTMDFYMMFYRTDVLEEVGVKIPTTWNELYQILPTLQAVDLEIGMPGVLPYSTTTAGTISVVSSSTAGSVSVDGLAGLKLFLYQMGGELYNEGGYSVALDENIALDAFESLCSMFSKYKCQVSYDLTRFRTGEVPIIINTAVSTYNTLMSYYDIRGLWKMVPLLGYEDENGNLNHTSLVSVSALVIPRGAENPNASWEYMKWTISPDAQKLIAKEQLMVSSNPTTKYNSPTIEALLSQAWTTEEYEALKKQTEQLVGVPEYPGNYILATYVNSAFLSVYNNSSDASEELMDRIVYMNKELSRKRKDFKMDYFDVATGEYVPGRYVDNSDLYE